MSEDQLQIFSFQASEQIYYGTGYGEKTFKMGISQYSSTYQDTKNATSTLKTTLQLNFIFFIP